MKLLDGDKVKKLIGFKMHYHKPVPGKKYKECDEGAFGALQTLVDEINSGMLDAETPVQEEWLPIESAPKTSKAILVWCEAFHNQYIVFWTVPLGEDAKPQPDKGFWSHFGGGCRNLNERPTHWMPLPKSPTTGAEGEK